MAKAWKLPHNLAAPAGIEEYIEVKPLVVGVMEDIDLLITMGCGVVCPIFHISS